MPWHPLRERLGVQRLSRATDALAIGSPEFDDRSRRCHFRPHEGEKERNGIVRIAMALHGSPKAGAPTVATRFGHFESHCRNELSWSAFVVAALGMGCCENARGLMAGHVIEVWRYPVSSLGGEKLTSGEICLSGIAGDRTHLLVDLDNGQVASPESDLRWRKALLMAARIEGTSVVVSVGKHEASHGSELDRLVSEHMGFRCGIRAAGTMVSLTNGSTVCLKPRYDVTPLHLITTSSLRALSLELGKSFVDTRRFRPNLVISTESNDQGWVGQSFHVGVGGGGLVKEVAKRCGMTMIAQQGIDEDAEVLRTIVRKRHRAFGVYATVSSVGVVGVGDRFSLSVETGNGSN
jgi:uncharacterized protein YcbX